MFSNLNSQEENSIYQRSYQERRADNTAAFDELELSEDKCSSTLLLKAYARKQIIGQKRELETVKRTAQQSKKPEQANALHTSPVFLTKMLLNVVPHLKTL